MNSDAHKQLPIGIFESGMGGLTVLAALQRVLPQESFVYLGDTARLPYGTKSPATVVRYAEQMATILVAQPVKCLVIACNTASMAALAHLQRQWPTIPIIGVIEAGATAAINATRHQHIAILATEATVTSDIYRQMIQRIDPHVKVTSLACGVFVALAEEGCYNDDIATAAVAKFCQPLQTLDCDTLLLGCTHFPVLRSVIARFVGADCHIIDSATAIATQLRTQLAAQNLLNLAPPSPVKFLVTDLPERFSRIGEIFLGQSIHADAVYLVDS